MCSFMPDELGCHKIFNTVIRQVTSTRDQFVFGADLIFACRASSSCGAQTRVDVLFVRKQSMFALTNNIRRSYMAPLTQTYCKHMFVAILIPLTDCTIAQTAYVYQCI